jgi:hypothetical protein
MMLEILIDDDEPRALWETRQEGEGGGRELAGLEAQ